MAMRTDEIIKLDGYGTVSAWRPGALQALMRAGHALYEAMKLAKPAHIRKTHNLITTLGLSQIMAVFAGDDTGPAYHAIGTGATATAIGDTTLTTEVSRRAVTSKIASGATLSVATFFPIANCTYDIAESGLFCGATASASVDTGVLITHYLQAYDNSAGDYDLTFEWVLTISRV